MKIKTAFASGQVLDWLVAKCEGIAQTEQHASEYKPSSDWGLGGPIIERENITIIRADDTYGVDERIPRWFAETSKWTGHSLSTSYEGENMEPTFMIDEDYGCYGPTPLIAAMRSYIASQIGDTAEVPDKFISDKEQ